MKHHFLLAGALLSLASAQVFATDGTQLTHTVTGTITPGSCSFNTSSAEVSLGAINPADLSKTDFTKVGGDSGNTLLTVTCDAAARLMLRAADADAGSVAKPGVSHFGLGKTRGDKNLGYWTMAIADSQGFESAKLFTVATTDNGASWSTGSSAPMNFTPGEASSAIGFTDTASGNGGPSATTYIATKLSLEAFIAPTQDLDLTDNTDVTGQATIDLLYL